MEYPILKMAIEILRNYALCDSCLGRQFAMLGYKLTNRDRGRSIKVTLLMDAEASNDIDTIRILSSRGMLPEASAVLQRRGMLHHEQQVCFVCGGIFDRLQEIASRIVNTVFGYEFDSFILGVVVPGWVSEREDRVRLISGSTYCEDIKSELSRELGKLLASMLKVRFDPVRPDLNIVVDPFSMMVEVSPTPIYIAGRFRKFKTGFPIRSKLCRVCMGRGCDSCGGLGVREISVEYALMKVAMDLYGCESVKLHLQIDDGRDRVVLGLGRSFILEVRKPKRRSVDLTIFREKLYSMFEGLIDVGELAYTDRKSICQMKASFEPEGYILRLRPMEPVDMVEAIKHLKRLEGLKIKQRYPGFKPRLKTISNLSLQIVDDRSVEVRFTSSEPLHTKSFIEGGRDTKPTIMEVTGVAWLPVDTIVYVGGMKHAQLERV